MFHSLADCVHLHAVNLGVVGLGGALLDVVADFLVGNARGAAVGVVDDANFFELKKGIQCGNISECRADTAAGVAVDEDFAGVEVKKGFGDAAGVEAGDYTVSGEQSRL